MSAAEAGLSPRFRDIVDSFAAVEGQDKLRLLLEYGDDVPELPERYAGHPELFEQVVECQSPVFVRVEVADGLAHLFVTAPEEAPTTRGFAGILVDGLDGAPIAEVLATPADLPGSFGLAALISPLRLRGMAGMLARIKRQTAEAAAA